MAENQWRQIYEAIGEAAALEMLAEECCELGQAALKLARIVRGENPARITYEEAYLKLVEEVADVCNALDVLDEGVMAKYNRSLDHETRDVMPAKLTRWYKSLFGEEAEGDA
jgi:NTP pyrophosphatase (non-canonical NTP hydrolase)